MRGVIVKCHKPCVCVCVWCVCVWEGEMFPAVIILSPFDPALSRSSGRTLSLSGLRVRFPLEVTHP